MANLITDYFETGAVNAVWTDNLAASVATGAKLHGNYGLQCTLGSDAYLGTGALTGFSECRFRFYIDPNSASIVNTTSVPIYVLYNAAWSNVIITYLKYTSPNYQMTFYCRKDSGNNTYAFNITDVPHCIEVHWKRATGEGANNGIFEVWIDGVSQVSDTTIDNDNATVHNPVYHYFGAFGGNAGNTGNIYLDDLVVNNDGVEIGQIPAYTIVQGLLRVYEGDASVTKAWTSTPTAGNLLLAIGRSNNRLIADASISGWTLVGSVKVTSSVEVGIWYKIAGASEGDVTLAWTSSTGTFLHIMEVAGITNPTLDKIASSEYTSGVTSKTTGTTDTPTANAEFCLAVISQGNVTTGLTWSNGYANLDTLDTLHYAAYFLQSAAAAQETTASWTTSRFAGGMMTTFKAGAVAVNTKKNLLLLGVG